VACLESLGCICPRVTCGNMGEAAQLRAPWRSTPCPQYRVASKDRAPRPCLPSPTLLPGAPAELGPFLDADVPDVFEVEVQEELGELLRADLKLLQVRRG